MKQSKSWKIMIALAVLLLALAVPRGLALDRLVTPDEVNWLTTSANFYVAVRNGDFANTYQLEHPGVTTMWAGAAGFVWRYPAYVNEGLGQVIYSEQEAGLILRSLGHEPLDLIVAGRFFIVLTIVITLAAAFLQAIPLVGLWPAMIGFLLIAFDPFHIAHSRILHQDGLASSFVLLTLLAFLNFLYRGERRHNLVLSGIAAGLAWLTKSPMLFLVPFIGLLVLVELEKKRRLAGRLEKKDLRWAFQILVVWGGVGLAIFTLLWPSMWLDPIYTLRRVLGGMLSYAIRGHTEAPLFFNGRIYTGDPGANFYPITYLWRMTPVVLLGLVFAAIGMSIAKVRPLLYQSRVPLAALLLFSGLFTIFMTIGAKKFDRYLLPIYPPLDLVAGAGWVAAVTWIRRQQSPQWAWVTAPAILLAALAGQTVLASSSYPYYFSYYNPMWGGTRQAPEVMMVGWGEGLDQVARFLNNQSDGDPPQVMLGFWSGTFSYFYDGKIQWSDFSPGEATIRDWKDSDFCIIYINQIQRGRIPHELVDYLMKKEPALIVQLQDLNYVYVYDLKQIPPPSYLFLKEETKGNVSSQ